MPSPYPADLLRFGNAVTNESVRVMGSTATIDARPVKYRSDGCQCINGNSGSGPPVHG